MTRWTMTVAKVSVELSNKDLKILSKRQWFTTFIFRRSLARLTLRIASHCGHRVVVFIQTYEKQYLRGDRTKLVA
ncbi:hypothetical protein V1478_007156 [Vespula squamosa]|uniref:Uncharacterized protein n=1 Tax=Vespula squamosa TaxID=30214 RepID=A0ABD2B2F0_VESSQ